MRTGDRHRERRLSGPSLGPFVRSPSCASVSPRPPSPALADHRGRRILRRPPAPPAPPGPGPTTPAPPAAPPGPTSGRCSCRTCATPAWPPTHRSRPRTWPSSASSTWPTRATGSTRRRSWQRSRPSASSSSSWAGRPSSSSRSTPPTVTSSGGPTSRTTARARAPTSTASLHRLVRLQHVRVQRRDRPQICKLNTGGIVQSSPTVVNPDGSGLRVYFGDAGLGGAPDGGHVWSMHGVDPTDTFADCSVDWSYDHFGDPPGRHGEAGSWSSPRSASSPTAPRSSSSAPRAPTTRPTRSTPSPATASGGSRPRRPSPTPTSAPGTTLSPPGALLPRRLGLHRRQEPPRLRHQPADRREALGLRHGGQLASGSNQGGRSTPALVDTPSTSVGAGASSPSTRPPAP